MAGIGFLLMLLLSASSGGWEISDIILIGGMTLTSLGLIVLGVILGSDSREMVATS
jgi:Zn-dependent membrane protease YugP